MKMNPTLLPRVKRPLLAFLSTAMLLSLAVPNVAKGDAINWGNLVVLRAGDGSAALTGNATPAFLSEFSLSGGSPLQTIPLPTAVSGLNLPFALSGSATSEGFLSISADGQYLTLAGYGVVPGTTTPQTSTAAAANRVVARIDRISGSIDTTTALGDAYNGSNIRSAVSTDGINIWTSGNGGSGQGASAGTRYTTLGSTTTTGLHSSTTNIRVVNMFNGQLFSDSGSAGFTGVGTVGTGLSTTSGQTFTLLPGMPTSGTHSPYDFWFKDANTLYLADDGAVGAGGGIQKWTFDGTTWTLAYTLLNNGTTTTGVRGLAGTVDGGGNAVLFGTTSISTSGNTLITVTDTGAGSTLTTLATAPVNTAFRGVEYIPEPSSAGLLLLGLLALARSRKA